MTFDKQNIAIKTAHMIERFRLIDEQYLRPALVFTFYR